MPALWPFFCIVFDSRYLSTGHEWSEKLRLRDTTKIIKYSLNPVWDEEFSMPVRRYAYNYAYLSFIPFAPIASIFFRQL